MLEVQNLVSVFWRGKNYDENKYKVPCVVLISSGQICS